MSKAGLVLITGGSGFIGTHLAQALLAQKKPVRILDLKPSRLINPELEMVIGDVRNTDSLKKAVEGCENIVHLAALASVEVCQKEPETSYQTNTMGTLNVLEAVRSHKESTPRVIFAGSASAYGSIGKLGESIAESTPLPPPLSFYAAQKLASEEILRLYARHFGIPAVVFRLFNVYGEGQDPKSPYSGVVSVFLDRIQTGKTLLLNGGGHNTRDYVAIEDVVDAFKKALSLPPSKCDGNPINIGSGKATSVKELAEMMISESGKNARMENSPPREADVPHSRASILRAKEVLGWTPKVALSEGLRKFYKRNSLRLGN